MKPLLYRALLAVCIGVVLGVCLSLAPGVIARHPSATEPQAETDRLLAEVMDRVRREYVDRVDEQALVDAAVRGIMAELDPHSALLDLQQYREVRMGTSGRYTGIGIEIGVDEDRVVVVAPVEGGPAESAGILPGDVIYSIDGLGVGAGDLADTIARMRGVPGSEVMLGIRRPGAEPPFTVVLTRSEIELKSVRGKLLEDGTAYLRMTHFNDSTPGHLAGVLAGLRDEAGGRFPALVLDLRNNPGGVLEAAIEVSDAFLEEGLILSADGRADDARFTVQATPGDLAAGAPMSVLVNHGSASAAEIVAGALQDHGRALVVGETTYGKGSVQTIIPLSDGRAIKLTTSRYFTPAGRSIHATGIAPDVVVPAGDQPGADPQLDAALRALAPGASPAVAGVKISCAC
jgi:carboxyl-terminal processing protease